MLTHGYGPGSKAAFDPTGSTVVSDDGLICRSVELEGGDCATDHEPRLLFDGELPIYLGSPISPDGRWIASSGDEQGMLRLWPMPDLSKPPLHTLPREELIAKLKTLTNLRVVRDEESATGWKLEVGPFPGWETVPEW